MRIVTIKIPEYTFDQLHNPYSFHLSTPKKLDSIAQKLELAITNSNSDKPLLIRGVQSGRHNAHRGELINTIKQKGTDIHKSDTGKVEIFAAPFESGIIMRILEGFHKYKPKNEERPQYPVDIWIVYDLDAFENVEYLHPRLNVVVKDKWLQKTSHKIRPLQIVIVN
jgi:hypothetical protein